MEAGERAVLARQLLSELLPGGSAATIATDTTDAFADSIGSLCRANPAEAVAAAGRRAFETFEDPVRPPATSPRADPSVRVAVTPDETVTVSVGGIPQVEVTVADASEQDTYFGAFPEDIPGPDDSYLHALVIYRALVDGVSYGPPDWRVFVNGLVLEAAVTVANGPEPILVAGHLDRGQTARGYLILEVPAKGEVVLAYGDPAGASGTFEVVLRDAPRPF